MWPIHEICKREEGWGGGENRRLIDENEEIFVSSILMCLAAHLLESNSDEKNSDTRKASSSEP